MASTRTANEWHTRHAACRYPCQQERPHDSHKIAFINTQTMRAFNFIDELTYQKSIPERASHQTGQTPSPRHRHHGLAFCASMHPLFCHTRQSCGDEWIAKQPIRVDPSPKAIDRFSNRIQPHQRSSNCHEQLVAHGTGNVPAGDCMITSHDVVCIKKPGCDCAPWHLHQCALSPKLKEHQISTPGAAKKPSCPP